MLYDAHNHYQDTRLDSDRTIILQSLPELGVLEAVVNGSAEDDWEDVARLARDNAWLRPSFGLHPWYVKERTSGWQELLRTYLMAFPNAAVGEIGLDRWITDPDIEAQTACFRWQLMLATELDRPATIHCLRAWGLLDEQLRNLPLPERGFLLHSYGGPAEMIPGFVQMGAYFSLSPYFGHVRKAQQLATFAAVPLDRLLAETDAPDMWPPDELNEHPLQHEGKPINHPANLQVSYDLLAQVRGIPRDDLITQIGENYRRLFQASCVVKR
ncbi:MAG: TatD family hydrolase [Verrucomicrobia bacterium]|nr:TatD family hydrolase [Verrucomicrobiota bacterium]